jgi:hypothetical protein
MSYHYDFPSSQSIHTNPPDIPASNYSSIACALAPLTVGVHTPSWLVQHTTYSSILPSKPQERPPCAAASSPCSSACCYAASSSESGSICQSSPSSSSTLTRDISASPTLIGSPSPSTESRSRMKNKEKKAEHWRVIKTREDMDEAAAARKK